MIYGVDCFKETTMKHKMLLYICRLESRPVNSLPSYCISCCKYSNSTVSLLNKEFSLSDCNPLQVSIIVTLIYGTAHSLVEEEIFANIDILN